MDKVLSLFGLFLLQVVQGQFGPPLAQPGLGMPFSPFGPVPGYDQDPTIEKYQPGKCLATNVTSDLQEFGRCVREIIDPILSSEGSRDHSFQEIYEMLSFQLFGIPPQVSFEQPLECPRMEKTSDSRLYVRLINLDGEINREKGRVQVSRDNKVWGTICDDSWDERDAEVVCKMLGHSYNSNSRKAIAISGGASSPSGPTAGPFGLSAYMCTMMDAVDCIGWEGNLGQCGWLNNSPSRCNHYEDAAVDCDPGYQDYREFDSGTYREARRECLIDQDTNRRVNEQRDVEVRLVDGKKKGNKFVSGRVEVRSSSGRWGSVCDDDFDDDDAMVICRQIGSMSEDRRRKPRAYLMGAFGSMNIDDCITVDDLHCKGTEPNIGKCYHSGSTGHNCQHSEDAAVDCNSFPYDVKLESVTQTSDYTVGVLMVSNDDRESYGAVTDCFGIPTWNSEATEVALKRLREIPRDCTAVWATDLCMDDFDRENPPEPLMHQVMCNATENDLGMCEFQPRLAAFTTCQSTLAIGLFCTSNGTPVPRKCQRVTAPPQMMTAAGMFDGRNDTFGLFSPVNAFGPFGPQQFPTQMFPGLEGGQASPGMVGGSSGFPPAMPPAYMQPAPQQQSAVRGLQLRLAGCSDEYLYGVCQSGILMVGNPPQTPFGTVCEDGMFTTNPEEMARKICGMINPRWTAGQKVANSKFNLDTRDIMIAVDELECNTNAPRSLDECEHSRWGSHNCGHPKDVALVCGASQSEVSQKVMQLNGGQSQGQRQGQGGYNNYQTQFPGFGFQG